MGLGYPAPTRSGEWPTHEESQFGLIVAHSETLTAGSANAGPMPQAWSDAFINSVAFKHRVDLMII